MNSGAKASCPLCGRESNKQRWIREGTRYFVCKSCRIVFQFPQPSIGEVKELYSEDYYRKGQGEPCLSGYKNFDLDMDITLARVLFEQVRKLSRSHGGKLLDVGCATGKILQVACDNGWDAIGVEISAWAADIARQKGFEVHMGTLEEAHLVEGSLDVVTMYDVIEHIPDPRRSLQEIRRLLGPGGALVLQTPNANGFGARLLYRSKSMIVQPNAHLILFSPSGLREMLEREGFQVVHLSTHSLSTSFRFYILTFIRRLLKKVMKAVNYRIGGLDLTRWVKRREETELPQFSFNDVIQVMAIRTASSS
jgi:SAM-dependent methyltransferase